ncbi:kinesin-like protein KIF18A isoform X2 [Hydra vulgaris]|uniref:Kinesin-like protein n=1 Tax=Hydra vulgaris TaxID=6087 RepID=A0ABM4BCJ6_HYDVU
MVMSARCFNVTAAKRENVDQEKSSNVKVVVRVRPPNIKELSGGKNNIIKVTNEYMLTFDPKEDDFFNIENKNRTSLFDKRIRDLQFTFDRIFDEKSTNNDIFEFTTKPVIDSLLSGYNCSVFAYGATSAGKTHTMLGSPDKPGVIFLTMMELYKRLMKNQNEYDADISVSYLEIYNETCKDLLLPKGPLAVREDSEKGVCINGLSLHKPRSAEELLEMLHFGNQNRSQHPTDANQQSSRSHAIFQVFVRQCPKDSGLSANVKLAKMSLIDLAGSERATVTTNQGDLFREGANINKSLRALGNCINALAENKSNVHIPYRNSKLTRLLKDSLGGNCKTIMIAAVSPSSLSYEDTYNTLKYANRAKSIESTLTSNILHVDYHVSQYGKIVEDLKAQVVLLQEKNKKLEEKLLHEKTKEIEGTYTLGETDKNILKSHEQRIRSLFKEKEMFKKQFIECEALEKEIAIKLSNKEKSFQYMLQISNMFDQDLIEQSQKNLEVFRSSLILKQSQLEEQKIMLKSSLEENNKQILRCQSDVEQWVNQTDSIVRTQLNLVYELCLEQLENVSWKIQVKHMRKCFLMRKAQDKIMQRMLDFLLANQNKKEASSILLHGLPDATNISWEDQSALNSKDANEFADFAGSTTGTPFKTPLKRAGVLKQIVQNSNPVTIKHSNYDTNESSAFEKKSEENNLNDSWLTGCYSHCLGKNQITNIEETDVLKNPTCVVDKKQCLNLSQNLLQKTSSMYAPHITSFFNNNRIASYIDPKQVSGKTFNTTSAYNGFISYKPKVFHGKKVCLPVRTGLSKENLSHKSLARRAEKVNSQRNLFVISTIQRKGFRF